MNLDLFYRFGTALVIGMLIGLEREYSVKGRQSELFAGVRTFALIGLAGCTAAFATAQLASPWPFVIILLVLGAFLVAAYVVTALRHDVGLTTEVSAIVIFLTGALCYWDYLALATAIGVTTMLLLSLKLEIHQFAHRLTQADIYATLKFAVISVIVLPVLPNQYFGPPPFDVFNPARIWLMVVFISGISFLGYVLMKLVDVRQGIGLTGLLGGLVSSTAVTVSFAQKSQQQRKLSRPFALAILLAWLVMFVRVLIEVAAINRALLQILWLPLAGATGVTLGYAGWLYYAQTSDDHEPVPLVNPFELGPALKFGLIYAVILLVSRAAAYYLGESGVYLSSLVAGIADVDAITLSMAELSGQANGPSLTVAARAITLATMSNTLVKAGIIFTTGTIELRRALWPSALLIAVVGLSVAFVLL